MKKILTVLLSCTVCLACVSQSNYSISGKIIDETTKLPLQGASVFAENTTMGTATDWDGGFHLKLPAGGYSIVITFTGYQTETRRVTTGNTGTSDMVIEIRKKEKALEEFVVKSTSEVADGLEKYGDFFIENFIGKTANSRQCDIKNKEVLKFFYYRRAKRLKIMATQPLEIVNNALGYTIKYELDSFVHEYNTQVSLYTGYPLFQEMTAGNNTELEKWNEARKRSYRGSILHFMRSLHQKKLKEAGFEIQFIVNNNNNELAIPLKDFYGAVNYKKEDSSNTVNILPIQKTVAVIYKNEEPESLYIEANADAFPKFQVSVINFLPEEVLSIEQNGFYYEQNDMTFTGYWAWEKVADMLPYDFTETATATDTKETVETVFIANTPLKEKMSEQNNSIEGQLDVTTQLLTGNSWQMQESRIIDGNNMVYYKRDEQNNTINFNNDNYTFNADNTGIYFENGQENKFKWTFLDRAKTKMEMVILYPAPVVVNFENMMITATVFKYTRFQKVNGVNSIAIETRTAK